MFQTSLDLRENMPRNYSFPPILLIQETHSLQLNTAENVRTTASNEFDFSRRVRERFKTNTNTPTDFVGSIDKLLIGPMLLTNAADLFAANQPERAMHLLRQAAIQYESCFSIFSESALGRDVDSFLNEANVVEASNRIGGARAIASAAQITFPNILDETTKFEKDINLLREKLDLLADKAEELGDIHNDIEKSSDTMHALQEDIKSARLNFDTLNSKVQSELENIRDQVFAAQALSRPVEFWQQIAEENTSNFNKNYLWFTGSAAVLGIVLVIALPTTLWLSAPFNALRERYITGVHLYFFDLAITAFPIFLVIWVLRTIHSRYALSLKIANDAKERITMMQTYLALLAGKHFVNDSDLRLALEALFRPSVEQKSDDAPSNLLQDLANQIARALGPR